MTHSLFDDLEPPRRKKSGHVPATSVEAYRKLNRSGRSSVVLSWLREYRGRYGGDPTSAELADYVNGSLGVMSIDLHILYVRRGLSDLLKIGAVEHGPSRRCRVSGKTCLTWRLKGR